MTKPYAVLEIYEGKRIVLCVAKEVNGAQTPNMNRADPATKGRSWGGMKVGVTEKPQRARGQPRRKLVFVETANVPANTYRSRLETAHNYDQTP